MAQRKQRLADALYDEVTGAGQIRVMPSWLMKSLQLLAPDAIQDAKIQQTERRAWVQKAVAAFRQLMRRQGLDLPFSDWQMASDGTQAIRVLRQIVDPERRASLISLGRQIQMTTLNHPGLAPLVEMAFYEAYPYVITRLRSGAHPLAEDVGQPMALKRAFRLAGQVSDALQYLHYRGMFHGALSPYDIFVDQSGNPQVAGVGIEQARRLLQVTERSSPTALTPPEVAQGGAPDARSDVYAVAALIYLLLTGRAPVPGRPAHVAQQHPAIPPGLDEILTKALAAKPDDRYPNLIDMNRALRPTIYSLRPVSHRPALTTARPPTPVASEGQKPSAREARPRPVEHASAAISGFPEPVSFPEIDMGVLAEALVMPEINVVHAVEIPPPPPIPEVNWETLLRPIDLIELLPAQNDSGATPTPATAAAAPLANPAASAQKPPASQPAPPSRPRRATRS